MTEGSQDTQPSDDTATPRQAPTEARRPGPWGFWPTIGFSFVIAIGYVLVQTVLVIAALILAVVCTEHLDVEGFARDLTDNGLFWSLAVLAGAPVMAGLAVVFAALARGITVREYLAARWPGQLAVVKWCLVLLLFILGSDFVTYLLHDRLVPPFLENVYETAHFVPLLWLAFVVVAPVAEEVFFRGFLFKGIEHSRFGPAGAVVISALAWALMHTQYDLYGMATIFLGGLLLGCARWRTRSLYVPIAMHMVQNAIATLEVALSLASAPGPV